MDRPGVAVVGACNLDIRGRPFGRLVERDSNPGTVRTSLGGVGRNIAHDLALLGVPVSLLTALGEDGGAQQLRQSCRSLGIDLSRSLSVPGGATSTYLVLSDHLGDMALAVSDMDIYESLTPAFLDEHMDDLNGAAAVVLDANLPAETVAHLAEHCTAPLFADPVSTAKAGKLEPVLPRLHTLKANRLEAQRLSGVAITDEASLRRAATALLDRGVGRLYLSLGPEGVLACEGERRVRLPIFPGPVVNATGCGDAMMAGLVWAFLQGLGLEAGAKAGLAAAAVTLAGAETINPELDGARLRELANL